MGEMIAVLSGKGGTGKTSVCAGVAIALAGAGQKVLCIDCDVGLRNLDISLGLSDRNALSFLDVCEGRYPLSSAAVHPLFPTLSFLTAPMNRKAEEIDELQFCQMLRQARECFDYVLLDAPAGIEAGFRLAAKTADRIILVTGSDPASVRDAARTGDILELMGKQNVRLVVNRLDPRMVATMRLTIDDVMDDVGLPLLGIVPEDPGVTLAAAFGQSLTRYDKRSPAVLAYRRIANRIQSIPEPIRF